MLSNVWCVLTLFPIGYSGVFAPDHSTLSLAPFLGNGTLNALLPITKRNWTFYGVFGETFSWFTVVIGSIYVLLAFLKATWLDRLFSKIPLLTRVQINGKELHHGQTSFDSIPAMDEASMKALRTENDSLLTKKVTV